MSRYRTAVDELRAFNSSFEELDEGMRVSYGAATIKKWRGMSTKPFLDAEGHWTSVFKCDVPCKSCQ